MKVYITVLLSLSLIRLIIKFTELEKKYKEEEDDDENAMDMLAGIFAIAMQVIAIVFTWLI